MSAPTLKAIENTMTMAEIIKASHARCESYGLDRSYVPNLDIFCTGEALNNRISRYSSFLSIAELFSEQIIDLLSDEGGIVILIADSNNIILEHFGDEQMRRYLTSINMVPGAKFDEKTSGTSSNWLAVEHNRPVAVVGEDHYQTPLHNFACYSVPFHLDDVCLSGTVTIMTSKFGHTNYRLALLKTMVDSMQKETKLKLNYKKAALYNSIVSDNASNGVVIIDKYGAVDTCNAYARSFLNLDMVPLADIDIAMLGSTNGANLSSLVSKCIKGRHILTDKEIDFVSNSGSYRCLVDVVPIMDGMVFSGVFIQIKDITEKHRLEQEIIAHDRFAAIGKLSAGLAHEIRNPLTTALGFMQIMMQQGCYEKAPSYVPVMYDELVRMKDLVSDFVTASKPAAPNKRKVSVGSFMSEIASMMEGQSLLRGVGLTVLPVNFKQMMEIDDAQIRQVLINIIQNALEACETEEQSVFVTTTRDPKKGTVSIVVEDNGYGMSEKTLNSIFNPFYTTKDTGTGLGMAVSYRIVKSHNGMLAVNSKLGEGSRVEVILPYK